MTRRQDLKRHRHSLGEIRNIMHSMKTLAYMETRKLARFLDAQQAVVKTIESMAVDFLRFHPETLPEAQGLFPSVYILIGTERGFCGDFNQAIVNHLESTLDKQVIENPLLIAVGRRLLGKLEDDPRLVARIDGPSIVEEVLAVLNQLVYELSLLQKQHNLLSVYVLYHCGDDGIAMQRLLPPFQHCLHQHVQLSVPPELNLSPAEFLLELTEQYLFNVLHELLYRSFMAENFKRVNHLEGAVKHLDDEAEALTRRCNSLRQEEIIEEIEVILLNTIDTPVPVKPK